MNIVGGEDPGQPRPLPLDREDECAGPPAGLDHVVRHQDISRLQAQLVLLSFCVTIKNWIRLYATFS